MIFSLSRKREREDMWRRASHAAEALWNCGRGGTVDATDLNKLECARGNPGRRTAQSRGNLSDGDPEPSPDQAIRSGKV
jgi:hypothetical protein